jgi:predicted MPP superfamily phosphohydrolase
VIEPRAKQLPIINRRTFLKRSTWAAFSFLAACAVPFYSYFAEPRWVDTIELELSFPRLPKAFDGMRVLQFSDVHYGFFYDTENLIKLITMINDLKPDMIMFTGDFFDEKVEPYVKECVEALTHLNAAPLGLYAVMGNHDYYSGYKNSAHVVQVYQKGGFKVLRNESIKIKHNGQSIQIAGIDDMFYGKPNIKNTFQKADPNLFTIFLAHEPQFADYEIDFPIDLQLSGHTHGGQIRLPLVGAVITPPGGKKYVNGLHTLDHPTGKRMIYTNKGIGTAHIPVRLLCRPEITVFTMRSI